MKLKIILLASFVALGSVAYGQKSKKEGSWEILDALIENKDFRIESTWARAQASTGVNAIAKSGLQQPGSSGNRFNLIGLWNYLEMKGDSVVAILPYYGERQFGGDHYSGDNDIEFGGIPRNLSIEKNEKKKRYEISFEIDKELETFLVNIQLYPSMKSQITVNSNLRFVIRYDGHVMKSEDREEGSR